MANFKDEPSSSESSEASSEQSNPEESRLIDALQNAVSGQRIQFCCGGTVPIDTTEGKKGRFDDVVGLISSPPVVLRWDLPSGACILIPKRNSSAL